MMKMVKKLSQISGAVARLTLGVGGAVLVFLALKERDKRRSRTLKPKS
ncbi:MAG: hypothetical protein AB1499_02850 [Nitrospirota bacterium]